MTLLLLAGGILLLILGAEGLVRGASKIAANIGIPPLVIGLTVVAFGTSAPEMAVSVMSSSKGNVDIAIGNVVGSNIFNVLFILGISALIVPLMVNQQLIKIDVPLMIVASLLLLGLGWNGNINRIEGGILFTGIIGYTIFLIRQSQKEKNESVKQEYEKEYQKDKKLTTGQWVLNLALVLGGLVFLVLGSNWLVESATTIAKKLGVSDLIIGLTIVAAGTSLPEVATSIIASMRGERDIAVGNVVGSNIFNILCVLGLSALVAPKGLPVSQAALNFDIPVMLSVAIACLPIFFTGNLIARWEGAVFLGYYIAYTAYLILASTHDEALHTFRMAMIWFVIPLTVLTLFVVTLRAIRMQRKV